ncbi:MAG TPA: HlyD family secretion protein, partial [Stellaceae bacterium]|nr:HlyD family secretion protein [Stellaceae bacterium]
MRKQLIVAALAVILLLAAGGGWHWWTVWRFLQSTDDAYVDSDTSVISPKVAGYIAAVRVRNNQFVHKGEVLFAIDDSDFKAKALAAEAAVASEKAAIATYDSRLALQAAVIAEAAAEVSSQEADMAQREADYKRYQALVTTDFASRQRFEQAEADARKSTAALAKSRAALGATQQQLSVLRSQRREEEAKLAQAEASLRLADNDLGNTVIRAPVSGVAGNRAGQIGQYVNPGTQLLSLVPLPHVYVTANFKETQLTRMRPGQKAEVSVDAYPDSPLEGEVESFAPASGAQFSILPPDNATGNFTKIVQRVPVRIRLPAHGPLAGLLRPGLSVVVTVDTRTPGEAAAAGGIVGAVAPPRALTA